jgi:inorganic phosphate transporter, PiT family
VFSPHIAVVWAAFFNFVAFAILGTRVARAVGDGVRIDLIAPDLRLYVLLAGITGATLWNITTWYLGLPTSSSHAIMGGYAGAAVAAYRGISGLLRPEVYIKTVIFIVASPLIGMTLGFLLVVTVYWIFWYWPPRRVDKYFRRGQLLSAAYSLGHGGNDAQKTMGIITAVLVAGGLIAAGPNGRLPSIPLWVVLAAHTAIALGTLSGGWRIVRTMGYRITKLQPFGGFSVETAGALTLFGATFAGIPVSTTHTITGAIIGVGATKKLSAVRWGVARRIIWAWVSTIPMAGSFAALLFLVLTLIHKIVTR